MNPWVRSLDSARVRCVVGAIGFFTTARLAELWRVGEQEWQPMFPAVGVTIAIALLGRAPRPTWVPAIAAGSGSVANGLVVGLGAGEVVFHATAHVIEAGVGFTLALLVVRNLNRGETRSSVLWLGASLLAAALGALVAALGSRPPDILDFLVLWTLGDGLGVYLISPAAFLRGALLVPGRVTSARIELAVAVALLTVTTVVGFLTTVGLTMLGAGAFVWVCLRGGPRYGLPAGVAVVIYASVITGTGRGPFVGTTGWPFTDLHGFVYAIGIASGTMNLFAERIERRRIQIAAILSAMPDAVVVTDPRGRMVASNLPDEVATRPLDDDTPASILGTSSTDLKRAEIELRQEPESGRVVESRRVEVGDGTTLSVVRDVTDLTRLLQDLDDSSNRWRRIVEAAREGIVEVDADLRITYASDRFGEIVGRSAVELIGVELGDLVPGESYERAQRAGATIRSGEASMFEIELLPVDGRPRWALASSSPQRNEAGTFLCSTIFVTDITDMKDAEVERIEILDQLADVEASEQSRLARDLHDGPLQDLTAVQLILAHLATKDGPDAALVRKASDAMIDALIALRSGVHALEPVDVMNGSLGDALERHAIRARGAADLEVAVDRSGKAPDGPQAQVLYRIGREAITNATRHADASRLRISIDTSEDEFVLRVSDDGRGFVGDPIMAPGHIGLRSIRERARQARGQVQIDSAAGRGTTVEVRVPARVTDHADD